MASCMHKKGHGYVCTIKPACRIYPGGWCIYVWFVRIVRLLRSYVRIYVCVTWSAKTRHLRMFSFLHFSVKRALSFVILQYEACAINSFRVTVLGSSKCVIQHLYAILWWLNLHAFNYKVVTHAYFDIRGWNLHQIL